MKKIISLLLSVIFLLSFAPLNIFAMSGSGTESNPYLVSSASDINNIHNDLSGYYKLTCNIDMSGVDFEPIGNENEGAFTGTIDGNGYTIKNLNINLPDNKYVGFVGYLEGTVKNLNLENVDAYGYRYVGGIAGYIYENASVLSCSTSGKVYGGKQVIDLNVGGVVGYNKGTVNNCINNGSVSSSQYAGGIVGYNSYGKINECTSNENVSSSQYAGGIIGYSDDGEINNCTSYGSVSSSQYAGGIIGYKYNSIINECTNDGDVFSSQYAGGIVGYNSYGKINECTNDGNVSSRQYAGGIIGYSNAGITNNCTNNKNVLTYEKNSGSKTLAAGGIIGYSQSRTVSNCINNGTVECSGYNSAYGFYCGGITGFTSGEVLNCKNLNVVKTTYLLADRPVCAGGVFGSNLGSIINCNNFGSVEVKSTTSARCTLYIGGIGGENQGTVTKCINYGSCSGNVLYATIYNAGIVAENQSLIKDCVNYGNIASAGIVYSNSRDATISNCAHAVTLDGDYNYAVWDNQGNIFNCINSVDGKVAKNNYNNGVIKNMTLSNITLNINNSTSIPIKLYEYDGKLTYHSYDESIATVSDEGIVKGNKIGSTIISATTEIGVTSTAIVTVKSPATFIELNKSNINLEIGNTEKLIATITPIDSTDNVSYSSSNAYIANVSNDGIVSAKSQGTATIAVKTSSGQTAYCVVTVAAPTIAVSSVTLNKTSAVLTLADKIQLNATVLPGNATDKSIVWKSSDEAVATVSNTGAVTAVSPGNATITATSNNGYYHECNIDVVAANGSAFIAKSTKASAGEIAEYTVSVVKNPGISSYKLNLDYDSSLLTPIEIVKNSQISGSLSSNLKDEERSTLNVIWYSTDDFTENADLFTIKFKVADNAEYGTEILITMSSGASDIKNSSGKKLAFFMNNTSIKVEKPLLGDIFEDGEIDFRDLNLLARNVSGLERLSQRQLLAADTEQDKVIDTKDTVRLLQHLTGWTGADLIYTFAMNNGAASVKVGSASINAANEAEIPVSIENNPGVAGFRFELDYDKNALDILSITPDAFISENFMTNLGTDEKLYVSWYNAENINADGTLFTIKVKYKDNCDKQVTPISIVTADNNMCNQKREDVIAEYETGYLMTDSFVKENEAIENGTYSADLYFDNSYEEKSAAAILALYDKSGKLITLSSEDITVKPGRQNISVALETAEFDSFKLFIWDNKITLKPLIKSK